MPLSLNARTATYYQPVHRTRKEQEYSEKSNKNNLIQYREDKEYNGEMSPRTKTKIKNYGANMILINAANNGKANTPPNTCKPHNQNNPKGSASPFQTVVRNKITRLKCQASFITLTLPSKQIHEDNEIKRHILQPFIAECKRVLKLTHYIWTAETQKNGNIHFHIITPTYINKYILQKTWNRHLETLGYITRCKTNNPPSTNIKGVKETGKAIAYITKYISKGNQDRRKVKGRLWGCDTETEKLKNIIISNEEIEEINPLITTAAIMEIRQEYFTTYILNIEKSEKLRLIIVSKLMEMLAESSGRSS